MNYKQCRLRKGTTFRVTWLPEKFAKIGKVLRLHDDDGWVVEAIWGTDTEENVKAREREHERWAVGRGLKK
jgi:hypothetical protein